MAKGINGRRGRGGRRGSKRKKGRSGVIRDPDADEELGDGSGR
jgi:hypothetical protein